VCFCSGAYAVSAVKVRTGGDIVDCPRDVDEVQKVQEGESIQRCIYEARVFFAPFVASKGACFAVLEGCEICEAKSLSVELSRNCAQAPKSLGA
jgi:hypothetical protein